MVQVPQSRATPSMVAPASHRRRVLRAIMGLRRLDEGDIESWTINRGKRHITRSLAIADVPLA